MGTISSFLHSVKNTLQAIKRDPLFLVLPYLFDLLFLVVLLFLFRYSDILYIWAVIFIDYALFQGLSWWWCHRKISTTRFLRFYSKFFGMSLLYACFFALFFILNYFIIKIPLINIFFSRVQQESYMVGVFYVLVGFTLYFSSLSYVFISNDSFFRAIGKAFTLGVRRTLRIWVMYIFIIVLFVMLNYLLVLTDFIHTYVTMVTGFIVLFPLLTFCRLFIIYSIRRIEKREEK
jgi:hypothetical protein